MPIAHLPFPTISFIFLRRRSLPASRVCATRALSLCTILRAPTLKSLSSLVSTSRCVSVRCARVRRVRIACRSGRVRALSSPAPAPPAPAPAPQTPPVPLSRRERRERRALARVRVARRGPRCARPPLDCCPLLSTHLALELGRAGVARPVLAARGRSPWRLPGRAPLAILRSIWPALTQCRSASKTRRQPHPDLRPGSTARKRLA